MNYSPTLTESLQSHQSQSERSFISVSHYYDGGGVSVVPAAAPLHSIHTTTTENVTAAIQQIQNSKNNHHSNFNNQIERVIPQQSSQRSVVIRQQTVQQYSPTSSQSNRLPSQSNISPEYNEQSQQSTVPSHQQQQQQSQYGQQSQQPQRMISVLPISHTPVSNNDMNSSFQQSDIYSHKNNLISRLPHDQAQVSSSTRLQIVNNNNNNNSSHQMHPKLLTKSRQQSQSQSTQYSSNNQQPIERMIISSSNNQSNPNNNSNPSNSYDRTTTTNNNYHQDRTVIQTQLEESQNQYIDPQNQYIESQSQYDKSQNQYEEQPQNQYGQNKNLQQLGYEQDKLNSVKKQLPYFDKQQSSNSYQQSCSYNQYNSSSSPHLVDIEQQQSTQAIPSSPINHIKQFNKLPQKMNELQNINEQMNELNNHNQNDHLSTGLLSSGENTQKNDHSNNCFRFVYSEEGGMSQNPSNQSDKIIYNPSSSTNNQVFHSGSDNLNSNNINLNNINGTNDNVLQTINHVYYGFQEVNKQQTSQNNQPTFNIDHHHRHQLPVYISSNFNRLASEMFVNQFLYKYGYAQKPVDSELLMMNMNSALYPNKQQLLNGSFSLNQKTASLSANQNGNSNNSSHSSTRLLNSQSQNQQQQPYLRLSRIEAVYVLVDISNGQVCYYLKTRDRQIFQRKGELAKWKHFYRTENKVQPNVTICIESMWKCFLNPYFKGKVSYIPHIFLVNQNDSYDLKQFHEIHRIISNNNSQQFTSSTSTSASSQSSVKRQFVQIPQGGMKQQLVSGGFYEYKTQSQSCLPVSILCDQITSSSSQANMNREERYNFKPEGVLVFEFEQEDLNKLNENKNNQSSNVQQNNSEEIMSSLADLLPDVYVEYHPFDYNASSQEELCLENLALHLSPVKGDKPKMELHIQEKAFKLGGNIALGFPMKTHVPINQIPKGWYGILNKLIYENSSQVIRSNDYELAQFHHLLSLERFETLWVEFDEVRLTVNLIVQQKPNLKYTSNCPIQKPIIVYKEQHESWNNKQMKWFIGYNSCVYVLV